MLQPADAHMFMDHALNSCKTSACVLSTDVRTLKSNFTGMGGTGFISHVIWTPWCNDQTHPQQVLVSTSQDACCPALAAVQVFAG